MKPKAYALYDGADSLVATFRTQTLATTALAEYKDGLVRRFYFLTAGQVQQLRGHEAVAVESVFVRNHNEKAELLNRK
jgi:hypothetical protein